MEECTESDETKTPSTSGVTGGIGGGSGMEDATEEQLVDGAQQPREPEPAAPPAPALASSAVETDDDAPEDNHEDATDEGVVGEDSPVFLTAVSHTTESDAAGGDASGDDEAAGGADMAEDVAEVKAKAAALPSAGKGAEAYVIDEDVSQNAEGGVSRGTSADTTGEEVKRTEDPEAMEPNSTNEAPADEGNKNLESAADGVADSTDQMEVDAGTEGGRNQSNLPTAKDTRSEAMEKGSRSDEDPCGDLVGNDAIPMDVEKPCGDKVKKPSVAELSKDDALRTLAKMPLPTEQAGRTNASGRPACALDGCNNVEQGRAYNFFCKKHCRMWKEANNEARSSGDGGGGGGGGGETAVVAAAAVGAASTSSGSTVADASTRRVSTSTSRRSARKRKEYDEVVVVAGAGEVVSEEVPLRSSKRGRRARNVDTPVPDPSSGDGHDEHLQATLGFSIEEKVKSSPRKASVAAASAVSHTNKKRRSTRSSSNADRPSFVNQVVRLTDKGIEEMATSRLIDGIDPHLYFVLNYNDKSDECDLVPMRINGRFSARESRRVPQSRGRDKWVLYSEKECNGQEWKANGRMLKIVPTTTIANTADADDEQWDVHETVEIPSSKIGDEAGTLVQNSDREKKSAAKFIHKQSVYAKEDDGIFYKAKVKKKRCSKDNLWEYEVHFVGWGAKYDRWVPEHDVVRELPPGETAGVVPNSSPEKKKSTPTRSTPGKRGNHGDVSSASTGTSIYAKCSSSNDAGSPSHHNSTDGGEGMLQVERILGRRWNTRSRQIEFLTVWRGYDDPSEHTWEPESNFSIRSLSIFKQMWGDTHDPPIDGQEEMLSKRDIQKLKEIERKCTNARAGKTASSPHASTEVESSSVASSSSPSCSVRRSTRTRTAVLNPTEPGGEAEKKDEFDSTNTKTSQSDNGSRASQLQNASMVVWTPVNECILLLTALEHPEDLVSEGPGLWMVTKSEWLFEGAPPKTDRQVRHHFEEMIRRTCDRLADHSALNYGRHVLNFALASAPPSAQAKNLALVAAGWYRIVAGSGLNYSKATWHRPLLDLKSSYCRYSEAKTNELAITMDIAWEEHEKTLRDGIEEAWIPTIEQGEIIDDGEMMVEVIDDEEMVTTQEGGDEHEEDAVNKRVLADTDVVKEVSVGIVPKKLETSNELADWAHFKKALNERKKIVQDWDPRPSLTCRWCGVRPFDPDCYDSKATDQIFEYHDIPATCKACKYLEELGWKFNITVKVFSPSSRKRKALNRKCQGLIKAVPPVGRKIESVKEFLRISTAIVSEEFSKNHALNTPSTPVSYKIDQGKGSKRGPEIVSTTSATMESKQKGEDKGAEENNTSGDDEAPEAPRRLRPTTKIIKPALPTFEHLLKLERGLVTVLESDDLHVWNAYYGTNSTVALCTLRFLATGKLPHAVQSETPFFRPRDELNTMGKGGAPPTRFLGVSRIIDYDQANPTEGRQQYTGKFGVEFPLFDTKVDPLVPKSATITGRTVLIRNDLTEDVAGRLYAFMFRLLYGTAAVERMLRKTNSLTENIAFVQDTLRAFGANEGDKGAPKL